MNTPHVVVAGAGTAGHHLAASLRESGFAGAVSLIGDEPHLPYHRPPLSKDYLAGTGTAQSDALSLRAPAFYSEHGVTTRLGVPVTQIDRTGRRVVLADDRAIDYDHLVLALGASPRPIDIPGRSLEGVMELRTRTDAERLREHLNAGSRVVVVGGGFIGLEVAAAARKRGADVTVLEAMPALMSRALSATAAAHLAELHAAQGVRVVCSTAVSTVEGEAGRVTAVTTSDGQHLAADVVVLGIGVVPNDRLAAAAGLDTANGIVVDERLTTSDPAISAVGDCASFPTPDGGRIRLESIQNAVDQARYVARRIRGHCEPYSAVPYFWSDQFGTKLQIVGHAARSDRTVIRGTDTKFSIFRFDGEQLAAVESINDPVTHLTVRKILGAGGTLTPEQADDTVDLRALARTLAG
ncbi:NAD(P)/FAD-dependent oxidoreductase [Rhodococcus opacus]|uniref:Ferredoxin reductase n=1 Tax=Rhodococcus opacus (strain B4) TaxID=632772 RepID=C1B7A7_RHOOB|nr:FAD-dependent oxidoreductase [Rhodococcus opacus]BAH51560.1 ferredoxin reductase [Rhodococcus opacus B4]